MLCKMKTKYGGQLAAAGEYKPIAPERQKR
jgi:hypothetical protein